MASSRRCTTTAAAGGTATRRPATKARWGATPAPLIAEGRTRSASEQDDRDPAPAAGPGRASSASPPSTRAHRGRRPPSPARAAGARASSPSASATRATRFRHPDGGRVDGVEERAAARSRTARGRRTRNTERRPLGALRVGQVREVRIRAVCGPQKICFVDAQHVDRGEERAEHAPGTATRRCAERHAPRNVRNSATKPGGRRQPERRQAADRERRGDARHHVRRSRPS